MYAFEAGIRALSHRLPKVVSPKGHAIIDYGVAAAFFLGAGLLWKRSRRAAIASLACGATETAIALLTDYPGGVARRISFETHGRIDAAISGTVAMLPTVLGLGEHDGSKFFRAQGLGIGTAATITDFERVSSSRRKAA